MVPDWRQTFMKRNSYVTVVFGIIFYVSASGLNLNGIEKGHFRDFTYKTYSPTGLFWCARYCVRQKHCQSFNFLKIQLQCELNLEEKTAAYIKFDATVEGSYYGASSDFSGDVSVAGACATHSCAEGETCIQLLNSNFKCIKTECYRPPTLENANSISGVDYEYSVGSQLSFTCNSGYLASGSLTTTCLPDVTWSPVSPCKDCGDPPTIPSAQANAGTKTIGSSRNYSCNSGYNGYGTNQITCLSNATWSTTDYECRQECRDPPTITAAQTNAGNKTIGSSRDYSCNSGYTGFGTSQITCLSNATWSTTDYECKQDCTNPPSIDNATPTSSSAAVGSYVVYQCDSGHTIATVDSVLCNSDGSWTGASHVQCNEIECGDPPTIPSAQTNAGTKTVGSSRDYSCNSGYTGFGTNQITCLSDGTWSTTDYECKQDCTNPPSIDNATPTSSSAAVGSYVVYQCDSGHTIATVDGVLCNSDGSWTGASHVQCNIIDCGTPPNPSDTEPLGSYQTTYGSSITFQCEEDKMAIGIRTITCGSNGSFYVFTTLESPFLKITATSSKNRGVLVWLNYKHSKLLCKNNKLVLMYENEMGIL